MGMFDCYVPAPSIKCPWCGAMAMTWQGKDGPNALLVWHQGEAIPSQQDIAEESLTSAHLLITFRLPSVFRITGLCDGCGNRTDAVGECEDGVWQDVEINPDDLRRAEEQRIRRQL